MCLRALISLKNIWNFEETVLDIVETLYRDTTELDKFLMDNNELSLRVLVDSNFRKSLLLASASHFEREVTDLILEYVQSCTNNEKVIYFIRNKALSRQYHTLFDWGAKNCNSFLGLFGDDFKKQFGNLVSNDQGLEQSIRDFLEIGRERNRLVHQNFASYSLEKTANEIHSLHINAKYFLLILRNALVLH